MYTQFIKQAEEEIAEQARDISPEQFSEGSAAAIGALLGAAVGGIGGYNYSGMIDEDLPEDKKFKKKLKNAITAGALGALGGAGLGYGGATALNTLNENDDDSSWVDEAVTELIDTPWSGTALGAGIGVVNSGSKLAGKELAYRENYKRAVENYKSKLEEAKAKHASSGSKAPFNPKAYGLKEPPTLKKLNLRSLDYYSQGKGVAKAVGIGIGADILKSMIKSIY